MPFITTNDGCRLHYIDSGGDGPPLVMLHGWSQSAAMFKHQIAGLGEDCRVIALDFRGHGESEKPDRGYRISRMAKDLQDLLAGLDLAGVTLLGWSMGCSVAWCYLDLFGQDRLERLVLVDQAPWLLPSYDIYEDRPHTLDCGMLDRFYMGLIGPDGDTFATGFQKIMVTGSMPAEVFDWITSESLKLPRGAAALLLLDHICSDWRDVVRTIRLPTLVIGGRASLIKWQTQAWVAAQIPGARLEIFEAEDGGGHFMFLENPEAFNRLVREHMRAPAGAACESSAA